MSSVVDVVANVNFIADAALIFSAAIGIFLLVYGALRPDRSSGRMAACLGVIFIGAAFLNILLL